MPTPAGKPSKPSKHRPTAVSVGRHRPPLPAHRAEEVSIGVRIKADPLVSNSLYLLMNTVAMAALGLVFWLLCAKLYTPSEIGAGTTLISASGLIGLASLLGFNGTLVRYLPTSSRRDAHVNTGLLLTGAASVGLAALYVIAVPWFAPQLRFVHDSAWMAVSFILLTAGTAMNQLTDAIFVAYRSARFNLLIDGGLQGISKILFAVVLQGIGAYGVFAASGAAAGLAVIASVVVLVRLFNYKPRWQVDREVLSEVSGYTGGMYAASLLNLSPVMLVPIIVVDRLGTADAGYFYIAFMIANVVFAAAYSVTSSLFAETSYGERPKADLVRHAGKVLLALIVPAAVLLGLGGRLILGFFGGHYSSNAGTALALLGLSAPIVAAADVCAVLLRTRPKMRGLVIMMACYAVTVIGLTLLWAGHGLVGVAWAWIVGNVVGLAAGLVLLKPVRRRMTEGEIASGERVRGEDVIRESVPAA
ncbi:MAG TPA: oligosaccharide flippase family protein [Frankiaceae bacterium]|nr:oligosaccharide flippase family protein [Frankiaceae bacterium]